MEEFWDKNVRPTTASCYAALLQTFGINFCFVLKSEFSACANCGGHGS